MPRIRSIHPGFWTDEAVVSISRDARLFFIGIWNQCDDKGVFEWKPAGLRMRIFPADPIDTEVLLDELAGVDLIRRFEADGRPYGVVRNFVTYQRPKKPNDIFPLPEQLNLFSGLSGDGSRPVRNKFGKAESEEGGRRKEGVPPSRGGGGGRTKKREGKSGRPNGAHPRAAEPGHPVKWKDGFSASSHADIQRTIDNAEADDSRPASARVVPITGRAHRR